MAGLRGIDHDQRSIVQQQPPSIGPDSNDRMIRMTFAVADDEQAQVISDDPGRSQKRRILRWRNPHNRPLRRSA